MSRKDNYTVGLSMGYYLLHKIGRKEKPVDSEANLRLAPAKRLMPTKTVIKQSI